MPSKNDGSTELNMCKSPTNLSFGEVLELIKNGHRVCREGWNGKNMFIYLNKGSITKSDAKIPQRIEGIPIRYFEIADNGTITRLPNINMHDAKGNTVTGWLASQTDILAEDWMLF